MKIVNIPRGTNYLDNIRPSQALLQVDNHSASSIEPVGAVHKDCAPASRVRNIAQEQTRRVAKLVHFRRLGRASFAFAWYLRNAIPVVRRNVWRLHKCKIKFPHLVVEDGDPGARLAQLLGPVVALRFGQVHNVRLMNIKLLCQLRDMSRPETLVLPKDLIEFLPKRRLRTVPSAKASTSNGV